MRKLKSLIEVPYVTRLKVQVLSLNMNLISSRQRVPRLSYRFPGKFGGTGKGSFTEKAKIVDKGSVSFLRRVSIDQVIHFGKYLGDQVKDRSTKNPK